MRRAALLGVAACCAASSAPAAGSGFAPQLGGGSNTASPSFWQAEAPPVALRRVAQVRGGGRQAARWSYARSLIAAGRPADAFGVLEVMLQDEPDLALSDPFQLARGRALVELGRGPDALAALDRGGLLPAAEACAWRLRAFAQTGADRLALGQLACAKPALAARSVRERAPFLIAAARAAVRAGEPQLGLDWLRFVPPTPAAAIVRGAALLATKRARPAAEAFEQALRDGSAEERAEAELGLVRAGLIAPSPRTAELRGRLDRLAYRWRGDAVEKDALQLLYRLDRGQGDARQALGHAATLVRYHSLGPALPPLLADTQGMMAAMLLPGSRMPLDQAAGLYWDYRDLAPGGGEGDLLAFRLADRLQEAGLYERAAGLLGHQLLARTRDIAQGPLSVRVAKLHILAGQPGRALDALRLSAQNQYPDPMRFERQRVEAVALQLLGRGREALAVLQDVPGSGALQAELLWKQQSWAALADLMGRNLPPPGPLSELRQAMILRQAITLAMLGRENQLAELRARYGPAFAGLPTGKAFDLLTQPAGSIDADSLAKAMASLPSVSPAGPFADLLDAAPPPRRRA